MSFRVPKVNELKEFAVTILEVLTYRLLLDLAYIYLVSPIYSYLGFTLKKPFSLCVWILSYVFTLADGLVVASVRKRDTVSILGIWFLLTMVVIPSNAMMAYLQKNIFEIFVLNLCFILMIISLEFLHSYLRDRSFALKRDTPVWAAWVTFLFVNTLVALLTVLYTGVHSITSLEMVYKIRSAFSRSVSELSFPLLGYMLFWQAKVINPLFMGYGIVSGNLFLFVFAFVFQVLLFFASGNKAFLAFLPLLFLFILAPRRWSFYRLGRFFIEVLLATVLVSSAVFKLTGNVLLLSLLVRRAIFMPGLLTHVYIHVFKNRGFTFFSHSFFKFFFPSGLQNVPRYVGRVFFGRAMNANANLWADGFAGGGLVGMCVVTLLLVLVLYMSDLVSRDKNKLLMISIFLFPLWSLTNSSLSTTLMTHGLLLAIAVAALFRPVSVGNPGV